MLKQLVSSTALVAAALSSSLAFAAGEATSSINISATIPTKQFHVMPRDPEFGKDEVMAYNLATNSLTALRQTYDVKNTEGSVNAYLLDLAALNNGRDTIPLTVRFNGVSLALFPQEVVSDAASTPGTQVEMTIAANTVITDTQNGLYTGTFTVMYDAVPRETL